MSDFGKNLAYLRERKGLNQSQVTDFIDVSRATWSDYERGRSEPNMKTLFDIARFFSIPIDWLILPNVDLIIKLDEQENSGESRPKSRPNSRPKSAIDEVYMVFGEDKGTYLTKDSADVVLSYLKETLKSKDALIAALERENSLLRNQIDEMKKDKK